MAIFKAFSIQCLCRLTAVKHTVFADTLPDKPSGCKWEQLKEWKGTGSHFFEMIHSQCPGGRIVLTAGEENMLKAGGSPGLGKGAISAKLCSRRQAPGGCPLLLRRSIICDWRGDRSGSPFMRVANTSMHTCKHYILVHSFNSQIKPMRSVFLAVPFLQLRKWTHAEAQWITQDRT